MKQSAKEPKLKLYDAHKENWDRLAKDFPSMVAMAKTFSSNAAMAKALNVTAAAISKWATGRHLPGRKMEEQAQRYFASLDHATRGEMPLFAAAQPSANDQVVMVVTCHRSNLDPTLRVLKMVNCEVEVLK